MPSFRHALLVFTVAAALVLIWTHPAHGQQCLRIGESGQPGDYALIPNHPSLTPSQITVEAWVRVHALGDTSEAGAGGEQSVLDARGGGGYQFRIAGDAFPLGAGVVAEPNMIFTPSLVSAYHWHHMAMTQDADSMSFYFDGNLVDRMANTYQSGTSGDLFLGDLTGCVTGCLWLRGEVDEVRIWDHARTQAQIADSMYVKLTGNESGLAGYWNFDEDSGTVITDATANGNDGALYGNAALVPSDAPVGFVPLPAPSGLRTHGEDTQVRVLWKPLPAPGAGGYNVYRADTLLVPVTSAHLLGTASGTDSTYVDDTAVLDKTHYYVVAAVDGDGHLGTPTQETAGRRIQIPQDYLVGVYYWPSRRLDPWWEGFNLREFLVPPQAPALGHYDSRDPAVVDRHLDWMLEYGIDFFASEWLGRTASEDSVLQHSIVPLLAGRPTRFTILYHPETLPDPGNIDAAQEDLLVSDFTYLAQTYFSHPNFLRFMDRPVVFLYRSVQFGGAYEQAFARVRSELLAMGYDLYLVGDEIRRTLVADVDHFQFVDAVTMWRSLSHASEGAYLLDGNGYGGVERFLSVWHQAALAEGKGFLPCVCPGTNTRFLNPASFITPRESRAGAGPVSQLEEQIRSLRTFIAPQLNAVMVWSWNHWESDSQIEPSNAAPGTRADVSGTGAYTGGYTYTGYGTQCLESVQSLLGFEPGQPVLTSPPDGALGQARRPRLVWNPVGEAAAYHLQISTTPDFASPVFDRDLLPAATATPDTLAANTLYHWRVRAQSGGGSGAWSAPFTFTTGTLVPVRLTSLTAERTDAGTVTVSWEILGMAPVTGFHVYRAEEKAPDGRMRLTDQLLTEPHPGNDAAYAFTDAAAPPEAVDYWLEETDRTGESRWYGPVRASAARSHAWTLRLTRNRPNPVRSTTTLAFTVPTATLAVLQIIDLNGRVVAEPFRQSCDPGPYQVVWNGCDSVGRPLPNGIYFYRLVAGEGMRTAKLLLLR